jgi:hypothetical protein
MTGHCLLYGATRRRTDCIVTLESSAVLSITLAVSFVEGEGPPRLAALAGIQVYASSTKSPTRAAICVFITDRLPRNNLSSVACTLMHLQQSCIATERACDVFGRCNAPRERLLLLSCYRYRRRSLTLPPRGCRICAAYISRSRAMIGVRRWPQGARNSTTVALLYCRGLVRRRFTTQYAQYAQYQLCNSISARFGEKRRHGQTGKRGQ